MRAVAVHAADAGAVADRLRAAGLEPAAFDTGADLEAFVRAGRAAGVLDLRLADLADGTAAPDRLTAASARGVPQVVAPGGLPATLTPEAADRLGLDVAQRVSATGGPAAVLLPLAGLSPAATVVNQAVRDWAYGFELVEVDLPADTPAFAAAAADLLLRLLGRAG